MDRIHISIRTDQLDDEIIKRLDYESQRNNRSRFIRECIIKSVHDEHIINKLDELKNMVSRLENIISNFQFDKLKIENNDIEDKKSVHDEHNNEKHEESEIRKLEEDILNSLT